MCTVDLYRRVRRAHFVEGMSIRQAARMFNLHLIMLSFLTSLAQLGGHGTLGPAGFLGDSIDRGTLLVTLQPTTTLGCRDYSSLRHLNHPLTEIIEYNTLIITGYILISHNNINTLAGVTQYPI